MRDKVYFMSDAHLGAKYLPDPKQAEIRLVQFLQHIEPDAKAVYLMGDILDFWFEFTTVVPRGYVRFFGQLAAMADAGIEIKWFIGNHDVWLFDYLRDELGIDVVKGHLVTEIMGKKFFLAHGDGLGPQKLGFRIVRWAFHSPVCQKLFSAVHPRWTVPLGYGWSRASRMAHTPRPFGPLAEEPQAMFAMKYLAETDPNINFFIFGHRHMVVDEKLSPTCRLIILGDWIDSFSYAVFDGKSLDLRRFEAPNVSVNIL